MFFEVLSKGCPYDFDSEDFLDNKVVQTILSNIDVTIHRKIKMKLIYMLEDLLLIIYGIG